MVSEGEPGSKPRTGLAALKHANAKELNLSFKHDPVADERLWRYESRKLQFFVEDLYMTALELHPELRERTAVLIGCPAGWNAEAVTLYEELLRNTSLPSHVQVLPESRAALLQAWEYEGLRAQGDSSCIVVIDIGSSTIDCSVINAGYAREHQASIDFGLRNLDEEIYTEYLAKHPDTGSREEYFRENQAEANFIRYLCRRHKERVYGEVVDLDSILSDRNWAQDDWHVLESVDVTSILHRSSATHESWLDRYRGVLSKLMADEYATNSLVLLTGGGAQIPPIVDATENILGRKVAVSRKSRFSVAIGLAAHDWLDRRTNQFELAAKRLLGSEDTLAIARSQYPQLLKELHAYLTKNATDAIWSPMSNLWLRNELRLSERGPFQDFAMSLFRDWITSEGVGELNTTLTNFSQFLESRLRESVDSLATSYGIQPGRWSPIIKLNPLLIYEGQGPVAVAVFNAIWKFQAAAFRALDLTPGEIRHHFGGKFMETALRDERETKEKYLSFVSSAERILGERAGQALAGLRLIPELSRSLDDIVREAMDRAVDESLDQIRRLLLTTIRN